MAVADRKDALKWWASPKNEAASQRPFELSQNTKSIEQYSTVWERSHMLHDADSAHQALGE